MAAAPKLKDAGPKILRGLRAYLPRDIAVAHAGVARSTFYDWMARGREAKSGQYREFVDDVEKAEGDARANLVAKIATAATAGDIGAAKWLLERLEPETFVRKSINAPRAAGKPDEQPADDDEFADLPENVTAIGKRTG